MKGDGRYRPSDKFDPSGAKRLIYFTNTTGNLIFPILPLGGEDVNCAILESHIAASMADCPPVCCGDVEYYLV